MKKTIIGLNSTSSLNGAYYPQKVQNLIIRTFISSIDAQFALSLSEYSDGYGFVLKEFLRSNSKNSLCFFSVMQVHFLDNEAYKLLENYLNSHNLYFALESLCIKTLEEFHNLIKLEKINKVNDEISLKSNNIIKNNHNEVQFITKNHLKTKRNYQQRATQDKAQKAIIAKKFDYDYWDGDREVGYGGYRDDGRWHEVAKKMIDFYKLSSHVSILDIGCGKGYLLKEFKEILPNAQVYGVDISQYAIKRTPELVSKNIYQACATDLPFPDKSFDLVLSNMTLHNLEINDLEKALSEINRVSANKSWIGVESYKNQQQKWNLMRWQLTCESFFSPQEWSYIFAKNHYKGDFELIYFD